MQMAWAQLTRERQEFQAEQAAFREYHQQATASQRGITAQLAALKEELLQQQARLRLQAAQVEAQRQMLAAEQAELRQEHDEMVRCGALCEFVLLCAHGWRDARRVHARPVCRQVLRAVLL